MPDFPAELDGLLATPSSLVRSVAWLQPNKMRRFHFDQVDEPEREALLLRRLQEAGEGG